MQKINANAEPYTDLPPIFARLLEAKAQKGLTRPFGLHGARSAKHDL